MWQQLNYIEALKTILKSKSDQIRLASGPDPSKKKLEFKSKWIPVLISIYTASGMMEAAWKRPYVN